ncbi:MAG: MobA/MobL family protein [Proteobacteria bacterium]|nr:MobA/MobL family protein [Pseudomonadota bacterium]
MSIMFVKIRSVSRARGGSAVAKSAYIARDRIKDAATGRIHDYRRTPGLQHSAILLPAGADAGASEWTRDRASLWNRAESAERARNARVAREYTVALPHELSREARIELARAFAQSLADRYRTPVDLAVHGPTGRGDPRNHHAHILATTRELDGAQLGPKAAIELDSRRRRALGLQHVSYEYRTLRQEWAQLANERLREARVEARLEPRSRATIERERAMAAAPVAVAAARPAREAEPPAPTHAGPRRAVEELQRRAVEDWLAYRKARAVDPSHVPARGSERRREADPGADAGLEL